MKTVSHENFLMQARIAEAWYDRIVTLAAKHGVMMVHDEILFESAEKAAAFNRELAELRMT